MSSHSNGEKFGNKRGLTVDVRPGEGDKAKANLEHAIKTLKRRIMQEGLVRELRKYEFAETKGQVRRRKHKEAVRRAAKARRTQRD